MSYHKLNLLILIFLTLLSLISTTSEVCTRDDDCQTDNYCKVDTCKHVSLLPFKGKYIIGLFSIFLASAISNAGGIGGGTLFLPVLLLILNFYTHEAVPLSKLVIFTGSLSSFFLNQRLRHPTRNAKALDYNLIILTSPNLLFGTILGVTLNKILPNLIIIILLTVVLFYNTYKTLKMGIKEYKEENEKLLLKVNRNDSSDRAKNTSQKLESINDNNLSPMEENKNEEIHIEIQKDSTICRWDKLKYVIIPFLIMAVLSLLRESSFISKCSILYWVLFIIFFAFALIINIISLSYVESEHNYRIHIGFPYDEKDIVWDYKKSILISSIGLTSGFIAGVIGIGGGVILGPILLGLKIHPVVSTVTTNFLVLLTSSSTSLQFMLSGLMNYEYGAISILFSVLGSYLGTKIVHYFFQKTGRESILIFTLVIVIGSSAFILPLMSIISTLHDIKKGVNVLRFNSPCK